MILRGLKRFFTANSPKLTVSLTVQIVPLLSHPPLVINLKDVNKRESKVSCGVAADCL